MGARQTPEHVIRTLYQGDREFSHTVKKSGRPIIGTYHRLT